MIAPFDSENALPSSSNGSHAAPVTPDPPSIEGLLFATGAISADQLGEVVREAVLSQRPVAAVALERGFVTRYALAELLEASGAPTSLAEALGEAEAAPAQVDEAPSTGPVGLDPDIARAVVSAVQPIVAAVPPPLPAMQTAEAPAPAISAVVQQAVAAAAPAEATPGPAAVSALPVEALVPRIVPTSVVAEALAVARAAEPPLEETLAANAPAEQPAPAEPASFAVLIRLESGERVTVDSADSFDSATEVARGIVETLSASAEWPFTSGRFIRPAAIVSIDIERALGD